MAITTEAGLSTAIQANKRVRFIKVASAGTIGAFFSSYRTFTPLGSPPAPALPGTTGQTLSRTSGGALAIPPASGISYLAEWEGTANAQCVLMLADRLVEFSGLSATVTTAQSVSALALPSRATGATDVELWLEEMGGWGNTASPTVTASYTNSSGTSGRTATLIGGIPANASQAQRTWQFALQAGDTGVQSVQSVTSTTSTTAAGIMGLVLKRTLVSGLVPGPGEKFYQSWAETDLQQVADDACLEVMILASGTTPTFHGAIRLAQG